MHIEKDYRRSASLCGVVANFCHLDEKLSSSQTVSRTLQCPLQTLQYLRQVKFFQPRLHIFWEIRAELRKFGKFGGPPMYLLIKII